MEDRLTFCRLCEPMCGLSVRVEGNKVVGIRGDRAHPLSRGWICRRGVAFTEIHNDPDRLRHPLRKGPGGFERTSWETALGETASALARIRTQFGPRAIAVYMGNPMAFCTYGTFAVPAFVRAIGTPHFFTSGSQDCNNKFVASREVLGSPVRHPVPDLDHVRYLLMIGANPVVSGMSFAQVPRPAEALRSIRRRGGEIVVVDPRRTETARLASEHLFIEPDTDFFFLLSLLHVILDEGLWDRRWASRDPEGFETLHVLAERWPPERSEAVTGIPAEKTRGIARRLAGPEPAAAYGSIGISLGRSGTLNYWLLLVLNLLSGHFDAKGGSLLSPGLLDADLLYRLSGAEKLRARSRTGGFQPVLGTYPAALLSHEILSPREDRIRALVVVAGNPLLSVPNEDRLRQALGKLDLLVCLDLYRNETGSFAHFLLPTTDFLEREDLDISHAGLQVRRYGMYTPAVVEPDGEQKPEWEILEEIAARMGVRLWGRALASCLRAAERLSGGLAGGRGPGDKPQPVPRMILKAIVRFFGEADFRRLAASSRGVPLSPHVYGRFGRRRALAGRPASIRLAPEAFVQEAWRMEEAATARRAEASGFRLIGKRERHTHNTWMHNARGLVGAEATNYAYLHPEDAKEIGVSDGDRVRIRGPEGREVIVPCRVSEDLRRKVVALPHGWGHGYEAGWSFARERSGVNVNRLLTDAFWKLEPFAGMACMNGVPVEVEPCNLDRKEGKG